VRVNLHSGSDLATKVQYNLVAFLEARFNLYDIPIVYPDFDVAKFYHVFVEDCDLWFPAEQSGRGGHGPRRPSAWRTQVATLVRFSFLF
jgi:hypothetical protein